jgi:hypothetical protein
MNYKNRLKKLEELLAPPTTLTVEIVDEGNDIVIMTNGKVTSRTPLEREELE